MSNSVQEQTVREFILESERNLSIAVEVGRAFGPIQREIVQSAMDGLEKKLQSALGRDWQIWNDREKVILKPYAGVYFRRKSWGEIYIMLEIQRQEEATVVGVWRDRQDAKMAALDAAIDTAFSKMTGKRNRYWSWYQELSPEFGNWNAGAALCAMRFRQQELVEYWADQLLLVDKVASPVIDEFRHKRGS